MFRHFPVRSSHPRAWAAACAAEAAGLQGRFWEMHDLLFADQGRLEDPHLWDRARRSGSISSASTPTGAATAVLARVRRTSTPGVRAGVVTTPTLFAGGRCWTGQVEPAELEALG